MKCEQHSKVYSTAGISNNAGTTSFWICKVCGEEGSDFTPYRDEYNEVKSKFRSSVITVDINKSFSTTISDTTLNGTASI